MFHFADDTCLLNVKGSIKQMYRFVGKDLKLQLVKYQDDILECYKN